MSLLLLPIELLTDIVELLEYEDEINSLARTCKSLYSLFNPFLYNYNVRHCNSSALAWGITNDSIATVTQILDAGSSPNGSDGEDEDRGPAALAAAHGNEAAFRLLLQRGADLSWDTECKVSSPRTSGRMFSIAASNGHAHMLPLLVGLYVKLQGVPWPIEYDTDTLVIAARCGHRAVVEFLLEHGADPSSRHSHDATAICCAARNGHLDIVRILAERGVLDSTKREPKGELDRNVMWPFLWAAENSHVQIVDYLLERVDYLRLVQVPDDKGAFSAAGAMTNNVDLVRHLLDTHLYHPSGTWTDYSNFSANEYPTALCWAASRGHIEIVSLLLDRGAELYPPPLMSRRDVALLPRGWTNARPFGFFAP